MMRRTTSVAALILIACASLAGCTSSTSGSGTHDALTGSVKSSTSSVPPSSATDTRPPASPSSPTAASSSRTVTPPCTSDIRVIPGTTDGAAGHMALVLVFNNVSRTTTCQLFGYPGVDLVTSTGSTVAHLTRTLRGMAGGEPAGVTAPSAVILAPGASASALAEASDVPQGAITDCGDYSLLITVPNQSVSVPGGTAKLPRCEAQIHPVVAGTTGGLK